MTVKELIEKLENYNPEQRVFITDPGSLLVEAEDTTKPSELLLEFGG